MNTLKFFERLGLSGEREVGEILQLFARNFHSLFTAKTPNLKIVESDPDDNKFFECAVALKAQTIVSGDKAVLKVKNYTGIKVLSLKQFIEKL
ncbi:MAG: putative toxin-antitoxin system toxin component, PIN family [bacterium]